MDRRTSRPRGLTARSAVAVGVFAATVVPGRTLGDAVERWTGLGVLDWFVTCAWTALAVSVLGPYASYRHRDAWLGLVPLFGWYLACVISWRGGLLPDPGWGTPPGEVWGG